jgi:hypothetical protein
LGNNIRDRFKNFRRQGSQPEKLQQLQTELLAESTLDSAYIILIVSSCAIATFGLLSNSAAVIIGAMIIAPLMLPSRYYLISQGSNFCSNWHFISGSHRLFFGLAAGVAQVW